ncbi:hypothetical protein [Streptomyces flaveolus]|uniref:hypothetical protein n=1 Tax=Streptomyces flaveolus TaxID=67297 RepID=UPI0033C68DF8
MPTMNDYKGLATSFLKQNQTKKYTLEEIASKLQATGQNKQYLAAAIVALKDDRVVKQIESHLPGMKPSFQFDVAADRARAAQALAVQQSQANAQATGFSDGPAVPAYTSPAPSYRSGSSTVPSYHSGNGNGQSQTR